MGGFDPGVDREHFDLPADFKNALKHGFGTGRFFGDGAEKLIKIAIDPRNKAIKRCVGFFFDFAGKPGAALQPVVGSADRSAQQFGPLVYLFDQSALIGDCGRRLRDKVCQLVQDSGKRAAGRKVLHGRGTDLSGRHIVHGLDTGSRRMGGQAESAQLINRSMSLIKISYREYFCTIFPRPYRHIAGHAPIAFAHSTRGDAFGAASLLGACCTAQCPRCRLLRQNLGAERDSPCHFLKADDNFLTRNKNALEEMLSYVWHRWTFPEGSSPRT
ncbi:MAG: hypothetical protein AB1508_15545 [Pseudomonadota bacterium]